MPEQDDCCGQALERKNDSVGLVELGERAEEQVEEDCVAAGSKGAEVSVC